MCREQYPLYLLAICAVILVTVQDASGATAQSKTKPLHIRLASATNVRQPCAKRSPSCPQPADELCAVCVTWIVQPIFKATTAITDTTTTANSNDSADGNEDSSTPTSIISAPVCQQAQGRVSRALNDMLGWLGLLHTNFTVDARRCGAKAASTCGVVRNRDMDWLYSEDEQYDIKGYSFGELMYRTADSLRELCEYPAAMYLKPRDPSGGGLSHCLAWSHKDEFVCKGAAWG